MDVWRHSVATLALAAAVLSAPLLPAQEPEKFRNTSLSFEERARDLVSRMTLEEKVSQLGHTSDAMADTYLPAFRATVVEGHAGSVMCAYNSLNGEPACANNVLLSEFLRGAWKFGGYVVSDCGAIEDVSAHHHFRPTMEEGVAVAVKAGTDLICGEPPQDRVHLERTAALSAVRQGLLTETDIDRAVTRLLIARFRLGMFDPPAMVPWSRLGAAANDSAEHRQLALKTAQESLVLLKNDSQLLPLKKAYPRIAVIGPDADSLDALEGNYNGTPSAPVTILTGIRQRFADSKVSFVEGTGLIGTVVRPVPASRLYTNAAKSAHGLKAEYFANTDLTGEPALRRIDPSVNFTWGFNGASAQLKQNYSVRWTGVLAPAESADYILGFTGQDGYRIWVDEQLQVEDWTRHRPSTTVTKTIHLDKGRTYALKIEYFQSVRSAEAKLMWGIPGREEQEAVNAARSADLVVMVLGLSARIEGEEMKVQADGFSGGDRTSLDLPAPQERLLEAVCATGKPVVLVLASGSALAVNWADAHVPAILEAWYPGESGGTAIAGALAGDFSPAGRLPVTFYKSVADLPPFESYAVKGRTYRYFAGEPLYPFGYGLSYTRFQYSNARALATPDGGAHVAVEVMNIGEMGSDEVVQLFLSHQGVASAPLRELAGFRRVHLERHETKVVEFELRRRDVSIVDNMGVRRVVPEEVGVWVGGGQPHARAGLVEPPGASTSFHIANDAVLPD